MLEGVDCLEIIRNTVIISSCPADKAILNSRGEFNRSHIPRLKIEEKEQIDDGGDQYKKKNRKILREQDN